MKDKKCPKCGLWNSKKAEVCDCGYNFAGKRVDLSISKAAEYGKFFKRHDLTVTELWEKNKSILLRMAASLGLFFLVNLPIQTSIRYFSCLSSIVALVIIVAINLFPADAYTRFVLRKLWIYPVLGIAVGVAIDFAVMSVLVNASGGRYAGLTSSNSDFSFWTYVLFATILFAFGLLGLYLGKKRVIDEIEMYFLKGRRK
jgi:hypothetical protein